MALQQKGLAKLMVLDYEVPYKRSLNNKVADALFGRDMEGATLNVITSLDYI